MNSICVKPLERDKKALYAVGQKLCEKFLAKNDIVVPSYFTPSTWNYRGHELSRGFYLERTQRVYVDLKKVRVPTTTPGFSWTYPGFKADISAAGVVAHETGHHVHFWYREGCFDQIWKDFERMAVRREAPVTGYEPNIGEAFAESMRLFILNPDLLRVGRPRRWGYLRGVLDLKPLHEKPWREILRYAHPKIITAAENWIARGQ